MLLMLRDTLFNSLLHNTDHPLNGSEVPPQPDDSLVLSARLKEIANTLKTAAISEDGTTIDYARLCNSDVYSLLRRYTLTLRAFDPASLITDHERLAFWINLYNILVIDAVIAFGIKRSVTEKPFGSLRFFRRAVYQVGRFRYSCDDIEHGLLRRNRQHPPIPGDPFRLTDPRRAYMLKIPDVRIHFALNYASRSSPAIVVYDEEQIDQQLDSATHNFVNSQVQVNVNKNQLHLSPIFKWYANDFGGREGIIRFLVNYLPEGKRRVWLSRKRETVRFVYEKYDWSLNGTSVAPDLPVPSPLRSAREKNGD